MQGIKREARKELELAGLCGMMSLEKLLPEIVIVVVSMLERLRKLYKNWIPSVKLKPEIESQAKKP